MQSNEKKGTLIVIDGLDGSGKSTQAQAVYEHIKAENEKVILISYPDYEKPSSTLVRMYLDGEFSKNAEDVNAYASSSFYAVDRYASFKQVWESYYNNGYTIIASRYVSSNAIHQMVKLPQDDWDSYLEWLDDYEHTKLGLPRPDMIIFLDMARSVADGLLFKRYDGDESKKDIHESNISYLQKCQQTAHYTAQKNGWKVIACSDNEKAYPIESITKKIINIIKER